MTVSRRRPQRPLSARGEALCSDGGMLLRLWARQAGPDGVGIDCSRVTVAQAGFFAQARQWRARETSPALADSLGTAPLGCVAVTWR
jgi:hypothetical protein